MSSSSPNFEPDGPGSEAELNEFAKRLQTVTNPTSAASEAFRILRTNILYAFVDSPPQVMVVTSPGPGTGKSTVCANLGVVLAQAGKNALILDCDFRKPVLHRIFGIRNVRGIMDVLVGERTLPEVWSEPLAGLRVVSAGLVPPTPAEILGSARFSSLLTDVRQEFDYVLVDAPPVGLVSDPTILATQGDGVLLVIDAQKTRKGAVRHAMRSLEAVGVNVLGTVLNNVKTKNVGFQGTYYSNDAYS